MQRKIVSETFYSWGPLFEHANLSRKHKIYSDEMKALMLSDKWSGGHKGLNTDNSKTSDLSRYNWLKMQTGLLHNILFCEHIDNRLTVEEIRQIIPKIYLRINEIGEILSFYENKDITGLALDKYDLAEIEEEKNSLEEEVSSLRLLLDSMPTRKIIVINNREDELGPSDRAHSSNSDSRTRNPLSLGHPHSSITLINASGDKRAKIAELFIKAEVHPKKVILDVDGNRAYHEDKIFLVLSTYSYFLQTDSGLKPFSALEEVEKYLRSNSEENWKNVVKFKIITGYERKHGTEDVYVRGSVSTYPVTHE